MSSCSPEALLLLAFCSGVFLECFLGLYRQYFGVEILFAGSLIICLRQLLTGGRAPL